MCAHGEKITPPLVTDQSIGWLIVDWLIRVTDWRRTTWPPRWCCSSLQQSLRTSSSLSWHSSISRCPYERHRSRRCKPAMSLADISYIVDLHRIWQKLLAPSIRRRSSTAIIFGDFIVFSWSRLPRTILICTRRIPVYSLHTTFFCIFSEFWFANFDHIAIRRTISK